MASGMSIEQFWSSTWREVQLYRLAAERIQLSEDRRARSICYTTYKFSGVIKSAESIKTFWPLPGDNPIRRKKDEEELSYLTVEQLLSNIDKHYNNGGSK